MLTVIVSQQLEVGDPQLYRIYTNLITFVQSHWSLSAIYLQCCLLGGNGALGDPVEVST